MVDIQKRLRTVRARRFDGSWYFDQASGEARVRAEKFFGTKDMGTLATVMAEILFPPKGAGRPKGVKTWTYSRYLHLGLAYREIKRKQPQLSDTKIAALLCKDPDFKTNPENLRQRLGEAKRTLPGHDKWTEEFEENLRRMRLVDPEL